MAKNDWTLPDGFDAQQKEAFKALQEFLKKSPDALPEQALDALRGGDIDGFINAVDWDSVAEPIKGVQDVLQDYAKANAVRVYSDSGIVASPLTFTLIDEKAVAWAREHAALMVTNITDEMRNTIRITAEDALNGGFTYQQVAQRIRTNLPLTERDAKAVDSFRERQAKRFMETMKDPAKAQEKADAKAQRYADKLQAQRARTIARTEIMNASNQGRYLGWEAGVESGFVDNASVKEWIAEGDACEICLPLDGTVVPWNGEWDEVGGMPPAHPNCRCTAALLPPDYADTPFTDGTQPVEYDQDTQRVDKMIQILEIKKALEVTAEIPEVYDLVAKAYEEEYDYVQLGVSDEGVIVNPIRKDSPTADSVHVDSPSGIKVPKKDKEKKPLIVMGVSKAVDGEERYTFSPWYVPDSLDAHGEWTDKEEVQRAFWKYLSQEDRSIRLQHNTDIVAGQWVEGATWPYEVTVPVKHPEGDTEYTFPAGTPFLGIIWEQWAWDMIKAGDLRGLSIGGTSKRLEADLEIDPNYSPTGTVEFTKTIKREGSKYTVYSEDGSRSFGSYRTKREAQARLVEIESFKED